jgi:hypothetical protein
MSAIVSRDSYVEPGKPGALATMCRVIRVFVAVSWFVIGFGLGLIGASVGGPYLPPAIPTISLAIFWGIYGAAVGAMFISRAHAFRKALAAIFWVTNVAIFLVSVATLLSGV